MNLYRLTVPTGAGKTFSSLRFALHHALEFGKEHIIYVAPFNSILEQNAAKIREAVGDEGIVLEHHWTDGNLGQSGDRDNRCSGFKYAVFFPEARYTADA